MKSLALLLVLMLFSVAIPGTGKTGTTEIVPDIPAKNTVTMVDLGAKTCIPCKLMAPQGQEVYRHIGFFDKDSIKEKLDALIAE
ncbi:MAG: hypothetical protein P8Y04_13055 [Desulfobulbaceae bacterium]